MHIQPPSRLRIGMLVVLAATYPIHAFGSSIDFITVSATQFFGGTSNIYDSLTGLAQSPGNGVDATFTSQPGSDIIGLTSASVSTTASGGIGTIATATSSASANLATGTMGVYATGNCSPPNVNCAGEADGSAQMRDLLTFDNTTGTTQDITVSFAFDGSVLLGGPVDRNVQNIDLCFVAGTIACEGVSQEFTYSDGSIDGATTPTLTTPTSGWVSTAIIPGANGYSDTFTGVFAVSAGMSDAVMTALMSVDCGVDGTTCDFSHTGQFSITLPTGVSFTSASGVLLTEPPTVAPEPGTLGVVGFALLILAAARHYNRRKTNSSRGPTT